MRLSALTVPFFFLFLGCSGGGAAAGDAPANETASANSTGDPLGTLVGTQTSIRGHNPFKLFDKVDPQVDHGEAFSHDETFSVVYVDKPGPDGSFFRGDAEVEAFVQINTIVVHHGGDPTSPKTVAATVEMQNNGNNTYTATLKPITLSGTTGDSDTVVTSVDVAFFVNGGRIAEQGFQQNYRFLIDNVK